MILVLIRSPGLLVFPIGSLMLRLKPNELNCTSGSFVSLVRCLFRKSRKWLRKEAKRLLVPSSGSKGDLIDSILEYLVYEPFIHDDVERGRLNLSQPIPDDVSNFDFELNAADVDCYRMHVPLLKLRGCVGPTVTFGSAVHHWAVPNLYFQLCSHPFIFVRQEFFENIKLALHRTRTPFTTGYTDEEGKQHALVFKPFMIHTQNLCGILRLAGVRWVQVHVFGQKASIGHSQQDVSFSMNEPLLEAHVAWNNILESKSDDPGVYLAEWRGPNQVRIDDLDCTATITTNRMFMSEVAGTILGFWQPCDFSGFLSIAIQGHPFLKSVTIYSPFIHDVKRATGMSLKPSDMLPTGKTTQSVNQKIRSLQKAMMRLDNPVAWERYVSIISTN